MSAKGGRIKPDGQVRQSQVLTTYGPGALVDLPENAVIIGRLEFWTRHRRPLHEERLTASLSEIFGHEIKLFTPPEDDPGDDTQFRGIDVFEFPEWYVAQDEESRGGEVRSRPWVHGEVLPPDRRFRTADGRKLNVVPIRFVQACTKGHISDINWYAFAHDGPTPCRRQLWLDERATSGDLADIFVRCECGRSRSLARATQVEGDIVPLGHCPGLRPWLGLGSREDCRNENGQRERNRLLVRSASNAYFSQVMSVIHIPDDDRKVNEVVAKLWDDFLDGIEDLEELKKLRAKRPTVQRELEGYDDEQVLAAILRRGAGLGPEVRKTIKQAEIDILLAAKEDVTLLKPDQEFVAQALPRPETPGLEMALLDRVVLVRKLKEVRAQVGFTRFETLSPDLEGELTLDVRTAQLARDLSWLPAVENHGGGVFIALKNEAIEAWRGRDAVQKRRQWLNQGFDLWKAQHPKSTECWPGMAYVLLHSLSHLLITALSLECGYAASSIRERIYAGESGYGILLFTGTPDAEGTLGGLAQAGRNLERHLKTALDLGRLCSNDPVCAQHRPDYQPAARSLQRAACHGCLLVAEPSCERRNAYLDRSLVVATVEAIGAESFREFA